MKKTIITLFIILIIVGASFLSFSIGKKKGADQTKEKMMALVNTAYPAPPQNLTTTGGIITDIYGNQITFEMTDPKDYLPHPDGSPHKKITKIATVGNKTNITKLNYTDPQPDGTPTTTELKITDLTKNQHIIIYTNENIRTNQKIPVTDVQIIKY